MGDTSINLSVVVGKVTKTPTVSTNQSQLPTQFKFRFDPDKYNGVESLKAITNDLQSSCFGSTQYPIKNNDCEGSVYMNLDLAGTIL